MEPVNSYEGFYGRDNNYSAIPATMMNASASDEIDWGAVVTNGIKGAAVNAIQTMVGGAYASGQLQTPVQQSVAVSASPQTMNLLIIGAVAWFMFGGKATA
jgi:hypothetical protein